MDASFAWELRVAQTEALLHAAERDKEAALRHEGSLGAGIAALSRSADVERFALAKAEARRYGLAADLMSCAKSTAELRERAASERSQATALKIELARLRAILDGVRGTAADSDARESEAEARDLRRLRDAHTAPAQRAASVASRASLALAQTAAKGDVPRLSSACEKARDELQRLEAAAEASELAAQAAEVQAGKVGSAALAAAERAAEVERASLVKAASAAPDAVFKQERRHAASAARVRALGREREALRQQLQQAERAAEAAAAAMSAAAGSEDDFC